MNSKENLNLGDEIRNIVQNAVNNKDFSKLNQDIANVAKSAIDEARKSINMKFNNNREKKTSNNKTSENNHKKISKHKGFQNKSNNKNKRYSKRSALAIPMGQVSGTLFTLIGSIASIGLGIAIFIFTIIGFSLGKLFHTIAIILLPFFVISLILFINGNSIRKRLKRFQKYVLYMEGEHYIKISDLALATKLSEKFLEKDLQKMISIGMFPEGRIDNKKKWFILDNETYAQYLKLEKGIKIADLEKQKRDQIYKNLESEKERNYNKKLTPEVRKSIDEGRKFVLKIKDTNIAIPGEEISAKLDRLEKITGKIFDYVEIHPEKFIEIKKFTEYFLPTTLKLLEAYRKLDYQSVEGMNISNAKIEIEQTIDTINLAFENLLDDLFQDMTIDVSTDISVLETMLIQEGLTKDNMRSKNKTMEDKK